MFMKWIDIQKQKLESASFLAMDIKPDSCHFESFISPDLEVLLL